MNDEILKDSIARGRFFLTSRWDELDKIETDQARNIPCPELQKTVPEGGSRISLPPAQESDLGGMSVSEAIGNRKSRRKYNGQALSLEELSFLLYSVQGVKKTAEKFSLRTVPSGGARHSFETYIFASRVTGLAGGLYRYLPFCHELMLLRSGSGLAAELNAALRDQLWNCAAAFLWTTIPYRTEWRYSVTSHKLIALDAGHMCQNLYLACEAAGCGTCAIGAYDQRKLDAFLQVDGHEEFAIYAAPVGKV